MDTAIRHRPRPLRLRRRDHAAAPTQAGDAVAATREPSFLLAKPEKRVLQAIARRLPRRGDGIADLGGRGLVIAAAEAQRARSMTDGCVHGECSLLTDGQELIDLSTGGQQWEPGTDGA